jgi:hypothetical protein
MRTKSWQLGLKGRTNSPSRHQRKGLKGFDLDCLPIAVFLPCAVL